MTRLRAKHLFLSLAALWLAGAKEPKPLEFKEDLIHSDVPLFGAEDKDFFPFHFNEENGDFGCSSRVAFGDWRFDRVDRDPEWRRISNYGVFHCALILSDAYDREDLNEADHQYGFVIKIGQIASGKQLRELWVIQSGTRTGSDYLLLSRQITPGLIKTFEVLQRDCPSGHLRRGPSLDVWRTNYCRINSKRDLLALAKKMAKQQPLGTLNWIGEELRTEESK